MKKIMILSEENEEFLSHFGVKGMRWGVRKKRESGGGSSGGKVSAAEIRKNREAGVAELRKRTGISSTGGKKLGSMTDKELDQETADLSTHYALASKKQLKQVARDQKKIERTQRQTDYAKLVQTKTKNLLDQQVKDMRDSGFSEERIKKEKAWLEGFYKAELSGEYAQIRKEHVKSIAAVGWGLALIGTATAVNIWARS